MYSEKINVRYISELTTGHLRDLAITGDGKKKTCRCCNWWMRRNGDNNNMQSCTRRQNNLTVCRQNKCYRVSLCFSGTHMLWEVGTFGVDIIPKGKRRNGSGEEDSGVGGERREESMQLENDRGWHELSCNTTGTGEQGVNQWPPSAAPMSLCRL